MCRFKKRCDNFHPDPDDKGNCVLLCQKNPNALALALMPDRFIEKESNKGERDLEKKIDLTHEPSEPKTKNELYKEDYEELLTVTQELDNEVIDYKPNFNVDDKLKANPANISSLIKKTDKSRNNTILDKEVSQAIEDSFTDHDETRLHPLDEINFEPTETLSVADQPEKPVNAEIYIKTRDRGRPPMSAEEKEEARLIREQEKLVEEQEKEKEALQRRAEMKRKVKERKAEKDKQKKEK